MAKAFTIPTALQQAKTLGRKLIPVADGLRDLFTSFGLRPYVVRVVRQRWTGARRGVGSPVIESQMEITPTPKLLDLATLTEIVNPVGLDEVGTVVVTQVSGRFTDEDLRGQDKYGNSPEPNVEVYYEIEFIRTDGLDGDRRRFTLRQAPMYFAGKFQWQITLNRAHDDRQRNGDPRL